MMTREPTPITGFRLQYMHGSWEGPEPPPFCITCGRPMKPTTPELGQYDPATGKREERPRVVCSAPWLLRLGHYISHAVQDEHGDWPWVG